MPPHAPETSKSTAENPRLFRRVNRLLPIIAPALIFVLVVAGAQGNGGRAEAGRIFIPVSLAASASGPTPTSTITASPSPTAGPSSTPTATISHTPTPPATGVPTRQPPGTPVMTPISTSAPPLGTAPATPGGEWHYPALRLRLPFSVSANGHERDNMPAELRINFTALMRAPGETGPLNPNSLRVVEIAPGGAALDLTTPFQFDPAAGYDAGANAVGTLIIILTGKTSPIASRNYQVYFDTTGDLPPAAVTPRLVLTDGVQDEGFASIRITGDRQTMYYHKPGGGFSSLVDAEGNDWIGWSAAEGAAGDFRGIPNMVFPKDGGYFHPGRTTSSTEVLSHGPLKAVFKSTSDNGQWESVWEVFPHYARLTVTKAASGFKYWFLYEGTPGGEIEASDMVVKSDGSRNSAFANWNGDLPGEEWVYITDPDLSRSIFLIHEQNDSLSDTYRPLQNQMTVLGFGRNEANGRFLTNIPQRLYFGLAEATAFDDMARIIRGIYTPLRIATGAPEKR